MKTILKNIENAVLHFIQAYTFDTSLEKILGNEIVQLRVLYKPDYFQEGHPYFKKGIGDVIIIFDSDYRVIIKQTIGGTWCFALLNAPYNVIEEHWSLSVEQKEVLPDLIKALEAGFPYRNNYSNLYVVDKKNSP